MTGTMTEVGVVPLLAAPEGLDRDGQTETGRECVCVCVVHLSLLYIGTEVTMTTVEGETPMTGEMNITGADTTEMTGTASNGMTSCMTHTLQFVHVLWD